MTKREPMRALGATRETDDIDGRGEVESRLRQDLVGERDQRFVHPQIRERQGLIRDGVVVGARREQEPAVLFRGGHERLRQITAVVAEAREADDKRRWRGGLGGYRIRHEKERRLLAPREPVDERRLARGACRLPARVERRRGMDRGVANKESDRDTENDREETPHSCRRWRAAPTPHAASELLR